jgi:hypothetical protein
MFANQARALDLRLALRAAERMPAALAFTVDYLIDNDCPMSG